ncbi:sortase domain-bontaining protein [Alkalihalobacillus sp. NPDC078783]
MKWLSTFLTMGCLLSVVVAFHTASASPMDQHQIASIDSDLKVETQEKPDDEQVLVIPGSDSEFTFVDSAMLKEVEAIQSQIKESQLAKDEGVTPVEIKIPALDIEAKVEDVGILENGQMGVPDDVDGVGWFEPGTNPGAIGNSVMAGHVDSRVGPAIFFDLEDLVPDDEVIIVSDTGEELTFKVTDKESYNRKEAPINQIFGATDSRSLNLITCSGLFNRDAGTHDERLVVYTELVEEDSILEVDEPSSPENVNIQGAFLTWHAVRDENVAGYRIYQEVNPDEYEHVESVSAHERKSFTIPQDKQNQSYYLTTVDLYGQESEPSEIINSNP